MLLADRRLPGLGLPAVPLPAVLLPAVLLSGRRLAALRLAAVLLLAGRRLPTAGLATLLRLPTLGQTGVRSAVLLLARVRLTALPVLTALRRAKWLAALPVLTAGLITLWLATMRGTALRSAGQRATRPTGRRCGLRR